MKIFSFIILCIFLKYILTFKLSSHRNLATSTDAKNCFNQSNKKWWVQKSNFTNGVCWDTSDTSGTWSGSSDSEEYVCSNNEEMEQNSGELLTPEDYTNWGGQLYNFKEYADTFSVNIEPIPLTTIWWYGFSKNTSFVDAVRLTLGKRFCPSKFISIKVDEKFWFI